MLNRRPGEEHTYQSSSLFFGMACPATLCHVLTWLPPLLFEAASGSFACRSIVTKCRWSDRSWTSLNAFSTKSRTTVRIKENQTSNSIKAAHIDSSFTIMKLYAALHKFQEQGPRNKYADPLLDDDRRGLDGISAASHICSVQNIE